MEPFFCVKMHYFELDKMRLVEKCLQSAIRSLNIVLKSRALPNLVLLQSPAVVH